jgi:nitrate/TMAO reductase-like tetraheme cytochrome c subunit
MSAPRRQDRPGLVLLTTHWLTRIGVVLVITALSTWLFFLPATRADHENPYTGMILYLILPAIFFAGLGCIALGVILGRRRIRERLDAGTVSVETSRRRLIVFLMLTLGANLLIGTQATYRAINYMETPQFCGATCHSERPQFTAHKDSFHASVECAECHVAPGQKGWIDSKMNGTKQLWAEVTDSFPKPPTAGLLSGHLVPSNVTCERCHFAEKVVGSRLVVIPIYASDEPSTPSYTVLMMLVGGSRMKGIHYAHRAGDVEIRYAASDAKRETMPWVEWRDTKTGETRTYLADGSKAEQAANLEKHTMQCVDCHNRATHEFYPADLALNRALALGRIPATLPFIKKQALDAVKADYASHEEAARKIPAAITAYYRQAYPQLAETRRADIESAGKGILAVYERNVYPELKVTWDSYPTNLGHTSSPGCFRCHDGSHTTADKKYTISQDCDTCHNVLAQGETSPEILKTLGVWEQIAAMQSR